MSSLKLQSLYLTLTLSLIFLNSGTLAQKDLVCQLIQMNSYTCETHKIQTKDDYILTVHRIPPPLNAANTSNSFMQPRRPLILMHGLLGSAADFILPGKNRALSAILHEQGYDVWLPNARGTTHSKKHITFDSSQSEFWNFTWHEIGVQDLPAIVDYVLNFTQQSSVHYVAHSQGCTTLLVMLSERPEYNEKIISGHLLAPVAFLKDLKSPPLRIMAQKSDEIEALLNHLGLHELFPSTALNQLGGHLLCGNGVPTQNLCLLLTFLSVGFSDFQMDRALLNHLGLHELFPSTALNQLGGHLLCGNGVPTQNLCLLLTFLSVGFSDFQMDRNLFPRLFETTPAGISRKQFQHFGQLITSGKFQQFDYKSKSENYRRYKSKTPPEYNLRNVRVPLQLFYGNRDLLMAKQDVFRLANKLKNTHYSLNEIRGFNHIDLLYSTEAPRLIYKNILKEIKKFYK